MWGNDAPLLGEQAKPYQFRSKGIWSAPAAECTSGSTRGRPPGSG